ncbi:hypothetical protein WKW80_01015 [Variovorax humicola]|uniref:OmpA family protein n=1 Tax=Variovorax humicola TaxID=1769758 RepID=A0ABU8VTX4_9BURK
MTFPDGSADLERAQILKLREWLDHANAQFGKYKGVYVETGASAKTASEAKELAQRRAGNTVRALHMLLPYSVPIETSSHGYREKRVALDGGNDYATIQINPDFKAIVVPDCNPIPIR